MQAPTKRVVEGVAPHPPPKLLSEVSKFTKKAVGNYLCFKRKKKFLQSFWLKCRHVCHISRHFCYMEWYILFKLIFSRRDTRMYIKNVKILVQQWETESWIYLSFNEWVTLTRISFDTVPDLMMLELVIRYVAFKWGFPRLSKDSDLVINLTRY